MKSMKPRKKVIPPPARGNVKLKEFAVILPAPVYCYFALKWLLDGDPKPKVKMKLLAHQGEVIEDDLDSMVFQISKEFKKAKFLAIVLQNAMMRELVATLIVERGVRSVWNPKPKVKIKLMTQHNETVDSEGHVQWASTKTGKNRIHVIVFEELDWLFVGIYDGSSRSDFPKLLMSHLYKAMYNELEGLLGETEYATLGNAHVMRNSQSSDVNNYDRQDIKDSKDEDESKAATILGLIECSAGRCD